MNIDLGIARGVDAQSFGQPGQRTFRLRIVGARLESAWLWLEKEHLRALSLAFRQVLGQVGSGRAEPTADVQFPEAADYDFRVGTIGLGFNPSKRTVVLQAEELGKEGGFTLRVELTLDHYTSLAGQLEAIIAAGRPICPLCSLAIDPSGHMCVHSNGHSRQPISGQGAAEADQ